MVRFKLCFIPNAEKLVEMIGQSRGQILMYLPDNTIYDLKKDIFAKQALKNEVDKGHGVDLRVFDAKDYFKFVNFMMEAAYDND